MNKWTKDKKQPLAIVLRVFSVYYVIGYIFDTDMLNANCQKIYRKEENR